jgi:hypothetical protein
MPLYRDRLISHIHDGDTVQLRAFGYGRDLACYHLDINRTDFPGRVELTFIEP